MVMAACVCVCVTERLLTRAGLQSLSESTAHNYCQSNGCNGVFDFE